MAAWIGATPSQRFRQYILPAARRAIEAGEWDRCIADYDAQIERARTRVDEITTEGFERRQRQRRVDGLIRDRDSCVASRERDLETVAEGRRRGFA